MSETTARYVKVGTTADVPDGRPEIFDVDDRKIAVYRLDGAYYAIEDLCTHDGGPVAEGEIDGGEVICPRHGARFDIKTGAARSFPAVTPVDTFPVRVDGDEIWIGLPE